MKIAFIDTTIDGDLIGGGHLFLPKLLGGLIENGHEVHLIAKGAPHPKVRPQLEALEVAVHTGLWDAGGFVEETAPVLARRLNALAPDVYVISASPDIGWVVLPELDPAIATVAIGHTDSETFYLPARHYRSFLTRVVGVSPEVCVSYVLSCVIEKERVEWIPYGVEARADEPAPDAAGGPLRLLYVGRLEERQKRVSDLVAVIRRLTERGVDYRFTIVGDGEEMPAVTDGLRAEIEAGRVRLRGWLGADEVAAEMRAAEVFVLTSAYEGFCIALVESMANGCAPVATDIRSGNGELVESGANGFLVPVGDTAALAERIEFLAGDRAALGALRAAAWRKGRQYGVAKMVENYENCFVQAAADARANPRATYADYPLMETCRSRFPLWLRRLKKKATGS